MRAEDLSIDLLLEVDARQAVRFAGERALILDAVALGLLAALMAILEPGDEVLLTDPTEAWPRPWPSGSAAATPWWNSWRGCRS
jgi:hypothetical protein